MVIQSTCPLKGEKNWQNTIEHKHLILGQKSRTRQKELNGLKIGSPPLWKKIGMKVLNGPHAEYVDVPGNKGVTGIVIIETSHIAMHVWDETDPGLMQLDVYSCGALDPQDIFKELEVFNPVKLEYKFLDREHGLIEVDSK